MAKRSSDHIIGDGAPEMQQMAHIPVLLDGVLESLGDLSEKTVVDGTFGAGGYSRRFLQAGARVIAIDRDPNVKVYADELSLAFPEKFSFIAGKFSELADLVAENVDAIVLDIGVSSMQLDESDRGFSFMRDGPLDMRMSQEGLSAADIVNAFSAEDIASILFVFGEERQSRRIARAIVEHRENGEIRSTLALAALIEKTVGRKPGGSHPATRSFQALRIAVNAEFDELVEALFAAEHKLAAGGQLVVVTFHSLEDRIVKRFFNADANAGAQSRHLPEAAKTDVRWQKVSKAIKPSKSELEVNPRARSSILRQGVRTNAAARAFSMEGLGVPRTKIAVTR